MKSLLNYSTKVSSLMSGPQMDSPPNKKVYYPHVPLKTVDFLSNIHRISEEGLSWVKKVLRKVGLFF